MPDRHPRRALRAGLTALTGLGGRIRRNRTGTASFLVLSVTAGALVVVAVTSPEITATNVSLNDGGVWVTGTQVAVLGEINTEIRQSVMTIADLSSTSFDVLQDGGAILAHDTRRSTLRRVDVGARKFGAAPAQLPPTAQAAAAGGTVAVLDPDAGDLWVRPAETASTGPFAGTPATVATEKDSTLAVGLDGTAYVASAASGELLTVPKRGDGPGEPVRTALRARAGTVTVTAVGDTPVVLSRDAGRARVEVPGRAPVALPGDADDAVLQQPGPAAAHALVSTSAALYSVDLETAAVTSIGKGGGGGTAAPVRVAGCDYGVWSADPTLVTACDGAAVVSSPVGSAPSQRANLIFRVNRQRVVLNNVDTGATFMLDDPQTDIARWVPLQRVSRKQQSDEKTTTVRNKITPADRRKQNHPPVAKNDTFGARPDSTVVIPVLDNDTDADGDVLSVVNRIARPGAGRGSVAVTGGGRSAQFTAGEPGTTRFEYTVDDGRGGEAQATVTMRVVPPGTNTRPRRLPGSTSRLTVRQGGSASYDVLGDWTDPEGDPLTLDCPAAAGIRCGADGVLTFTDTGRQGDTQIVRVRVSDGQGGTTSGQVRVSVVRSGSEPPLARSDSAQTYAGSPVTIKPLENDTAYSLDPLRLGQIDRTDVTSAVRASDDGTLTFRSSTVGTSYLTYAVTAGRQSSYGLVRVDVRRRAGDRAPVAGPDSTQVRPLVPAVVDVLDNDSDEDGDILVVTRAEMARKALAGSVKVEILGHRLLRLTADPDLPSPTTLTYWISDGTHEVPGTVTLRTAAQDTDNQAPAARDDEAVARAGQVLSVPVLADDTDPDGDQVRLDQDLAYVTFRPRDGSSTTDVNVFTSGDRVRLYAPDRPGTLSATYTARDDRGLPDSAQLSVRVVARDAPNNPPEPQPVQARAVAGQPSRITVPLDGLDPDGDPVTLGPPVRQPLLGTVALDPARGDQLVYTPREDARGRDEFTYQVFDASGSVATSVVRIGVAPLPADAHPPVPVDDTVAVRNNKERSVSVLVAANDTDPDGDPVRLAAEDPVKALTEGLTPVVREQAVEITVPQGETAQQIVAYRITAGGLAAGRQGVLSVTPRPDAPLLPPTAKDDTARATGPGRPVAVPVLQNDTDPDGSPAELAVSDEAGAVGPAALARRTDRGTVTVTPGRTSAWAWYTITDVDGQSARAFIYVQGSDGPPHLREGVRPFTLKAGDTGRIKLSDYVVAPSGQDVRITELAAISGSGLQAASAAEGTALDLTPSIDFGPAAVTFEVMDAETINDPAARRAFVTVPVTVEGADNRAPRVRPQTVSVEEGSAQGQTVNLETATDDDPDDAGKHTYTVAGAGPGITATIAGGVLTVAGENARAGATQRLTVTADDSELTGTGTVVVQVIATLAPPPVAADCGPAGSQFVKPGRVVVDLGACTVNPFPDTPLTVDQVAPGDPAMGSATAGGLKVTLDVPAAFAGTASYAYTVKDKVGRTVSGRILLTVIDNPGAPGRPEAVGQPGDGTVALKWTAADPRGGRITGYRVKDAGHGVEHTCAGDLTQCQVPDLENDVSYTFSVAAVNEQGEGTASPASAAIRPDVRPEPPAGLTVTAGDKGAALVWQVQSRGSGVSSYTVNWTGTDGSASGVTRTVAPQKTGSLQADVPGLKNGVGYAFTVTQRNASIVGDSDAVSSDPVYPAGPARAPSAPTATRAPGPAGGQIIVTWDPANVKDAANGRLEAFTIVETSGRLGDFDATGSVDAGSRTFDVQTDKSYRFALRVRNNIDSTSTGAPSPETTAEGTPSTPTWNGAPVAADGKARLAFANIVANGLSVKSIRISGGPADVTVTPGGSAFTGVEIPNLKNGTTYSFQIEVCNATNCATSARSGSVIPFGPPIVTAPRATVDELDVTVTWDPADGNGRPITNSYVQISNGGSRCAGTAGRCTFKGVDGRSYTATYVVTTQGGTRQADSGSVTAKAPAPPRSVTVERGAFLSRADCTACYYVRVTISGFTPGDHTVRLSNADGDWCPTGGGACSSGVYTITANSAGNATKEAYYYGWPRRWVSAEVEGVTGRKDPWGP